MLELNKIYNMDCLIGMKLIPDKSIDMIFCDLPYGTTQSPWDIVIPFAPMWEQYERIIKDSGAIVLMCCEPFTSQLVCSNPRLYKDRWTWVKNKSTCHFNAKKMPLNITEDIRVFYKNPPVYNPQKTTGHKPMNFAIGNHKSGVYGKGKNTANNAGATDRYPNDVVYFKVVNNDDPKRIHENQKPVSLVRYFIRTYTNEGDVVYDGCSGSGSTPEACILEGRNFIAMEKDKIKYDKSIVAFDKFVHDLKYQPHFNFHPPKGEEL